MTYLAYSYIIKSVSIIIILLKLILKYLQMSNVPSEKLKIVNFNLGHEKNLLITSFFFFCIMFVINIIAKCVQSFLGGF